MVNCNSSLFSSGERPHGARRDDDDDAWNLSGETTVDVAVIKMPENYNVAREYIVKRLAKSMSWFRLERYNRAHNLFSFDFMVSSVIILHNNLV